MASTAKNMGTQTYNPLQRKRVLTGVSFTINDVAGDIIDVSGTLELRDSVTNELLDITVVTKRYTAEQANTLLAGGLQNLPNTYDKLRNALATLVHALVDLP